jgi:hypothetical protein
MAVHPSLFQKLDSEIGWIGSGAELDRPLGRFSDLVSFVEEAYGQAFATFGGLDIRGFGESQKAEAYAAEQRFERDDADVAPALFALLASYQELCDDWPDVLGPQYGGSDAEFEDFRRRVIPDLLENLADLAASGGDSELHRVASAYLQQWLDAIATNRSIHADE